MSNYTTAKEEMMEKFEKKFVFGAKGGKVTNKDGESMNGKGNDQFTPNRIKSFLSTYSQIIAKAVRMDLAAEVEKITPDTKFGSLYFTPTKVGEIKKYFLSLLTHSLEEEI